MPMSDSQSKRDPLTAALIRAARKIGDPLCRRWLLKLLEKGEHAESGDVVPPRTKQEESHVE